METKQATSNKTSDKGKRLIDPDSFLQWVIKRFKCVPLVGSCDNDSESIKLLIAQGERIVDLETKLQALNATELRPEDIQFFQSPEMVAICKRIRIAFENGTLKPH